jgi:hypothetical protein
MLTLIQPAEGLRRFQRVKPTSAASSTAESVLNMATSACVVSILITASKLVAQPD